MLQESREAGCGLGCVPGAMILGDYLTLLSPRFF